MLKSSNKNLPYKITKSTPNKIKSTSYLCLTKEIKKYQISKLVGNQRLVYGSNFFKLKTIKIERARKLEKS